MESRVGCTDLRKLLVSRYCSGNIDEENCHSVARALIKTRCSETLPWRQNSAVCDRRAKRFAIACGFSVGLAFNLFSFSDRGVHPPAPDYGCTRCPSLRLALRSRQSSLSITLFSRHGDRALALDVADHARYCCTYEQMPTGTNCY